MGADFLFAATFVPTKEEAERARKKIAALAPDDAPEPYDDIDEYRDRLTDCLDQLLDSDTRRDCGGIFLGERYLLITGGMSWGDEPTDMCQFIWDLDEANVLPNVWEEYEFRRKAVDPEAVEVARAHLEKMTGGAR